MPPDQRESFGRRVGRRDNKEKQENKKNHRVILAFVMLFQSDRV